MKTKRFIVDMEFGSDWQQEFLTTTFKLMIAGMKTHAESAHKKNKITVTEQLK